MRSFSATTGVSTQLLLCWVLLPAYGLVLGDDDNGTPKPTPSPTTPAPNPYQPHDRICRSYLSTFLKGTTDVRDECQGLLNAYATGGCKINGDDDGMGADDDGDPWRRWWHDLFGDDDAAGPPSDAYDEAGKDGRYLLEDASDDDQVTMIDDTYENHACCRTIRSYYSVRCPKEGERAVDPTVLLIGSAILIVCGVVKSLIRSMEDARDQDATNRWSGCWSFLQSLPEAAGCILVGAAAGIIVRIAVPGIDLDRVAFDDDLFLSILLPPIIFQATLAIDKAALARNLVPIVTFAVVGTVLSALLTGGMLFVGTKVTSTPIPALDATIFGALISSIDPVATLSVLSSVGIRESEAIYVLVFGESLLNDGVAIVLFKTLLDHLDGQGGFASDDETALDLVATVAAKFCVVSIGSIAIGLLTGAACTFYFWMIRGRHVPVAEVGIFFIWALLPYYIADDLGYSSVIAMMATLFFADVFVIGRRRNEAGGDHIHYAECNVNEEEPDTSAVRHEESRQNPLFSTSGQLSSVSRHHIDFVAEVCSSLMEIVIFAYLGLFLFADKHHDIPLSAIAIVSCVGSRAIMVGLLSRVLNGFRYIVLKSRHLLFRSSRDEPNNATAEAMEASLIAESHPFPQRRDSHSEYREGQVLDSKMQRILFLSGIRGAVSLALVENIPLYNAVTHEGSQFKAELKTMTISSIIFTVFAFGTATYKLMKNDRLTIDDDGDIGGTLASRRRQEDRTGALNELLLSTADEPESEVPTMDHVDLNAGVQEGRGAEVDYA